MSDELRKAAEAVVAEQRHMQWKTTEVYLVSVAVRDRLVAALSAPDELEEAVEIIEGYHANYPSRKARDFLSRHIERMAGYERLQQRVAEAVKLLERCQHLTCLNPIQTSEPMLHGQLCGEINEFLSRHRKDGGT